jgi:hypothetical protein
MRRSPLPSTLSTQMAVPVLPLPEGVLESRLTAMCVPLGDHEK